MELDAKAVGICIAKLGGGKSPESCRGTMALRDATAKTIILTRAKELYEHEKNSIIWTKQVRKPCIRLPSVHSSAYTT